jgi:hypothetical protein
MDIHKGAFVVSLKFSYDFREGLLDTVDCGIIKLYLAVNNNGRGLHCCGMLHCIGWWLLTNLAGQPIGNKMS